MIDWDKYYRWDQEHVTRNGSIMLEDAFICCVLPFVPASSISKDGLNAAIEHLTTIESLRPIHSRQAAAVALSTALSIAQMYTKLAPKPLT